MDMELSSSSSSTTVASSPASSPPLGRCVLRFRLPPAWTPEEDAVLERLAMEHGSRHWRRVAAQMPRRRSPAQCRDRWGDHLARDVFHRPFTAAGRRRARPPLPAPRRRRWLRRRPPMEGRQQGRLRPQLVRREATLEGAAQERRVPRRAVASEDDDDGAASQCRDHDDVLMNCG
ncbi:hypothetical protein OsJ_20827 [Oryza sativa Japonica Group]|uniref:Uncharacterized protein n=1 Tax=Oryza sativa subsp. japonica TaxID=39947 RepID=B9FSJ4_ORYSJ|nr:hypothetical protein OsJ_20827 [Oryza sativa Japonica Group]